MEVVRHCWGKAFRGKTFTVLAMPGGPSGGFGAVILSLLETRNRRKAHGQDCLYYKFGGREKFA